MPELPEVETVRCGLAPAMEGARFERIEARRRDLRFPLPRGFARRLEGQTVDNMGRRGKYLVAHLSGGACLIMHLGMSGRFTIKGEGARRPGEFAHAGEANPKHDHVIFHMVGAEGRVRVVYNDPRRFGFMDLAPATGLEECRHFKTMGPEPLGNGFSPAVLNEALKGKKVPIKTALLDQRVVAGVGNIYASEALFRARISPRRQAASVAGVRGERLYRAIVEVLRDAITAGGSSLKDFADVGEGLGYFQHRFKVYDREDAPCEVCGNPIGRISQSGRSTFFCSSCQR